MTINQQSDQWGQIVAEATNDDNFKKRLLANPSAVLKENGLEVPAGVQIRVLEDTDRILHLTIPISPREQELSDEQLAGVAGGTRIGTGSGLGAITIGPTAGPKPKQPDVSTPVGGKDQPFQPQSTPRPQ